MNSYLYIQSNENELEISFYNYSCMFLPHLFPPLQIIELINQQFNTILTYFHHPLKKLLIINPYSYEWFYENPHVYNFMYKKLHIQGIFLRIDAIIYHMNVSCHV